MNTQYLPLKTAISELVMHILFVCIFITVYIVLNVKAKNS